jgi:hypothetical protein
MTNQDERDAAAWLAWWEHNKSKSQEDWIRDGFQKHGVELQTPLTPSNMLALLKMAGCTDPALGDEEESQAPPKESQVPHYVRYNAFRWLRDSDFDPYSFRVEDLPAKGGKEVLQGLLRLAAAQAVLPKDDGLGVLNLGRPPHAPGEPPAAATLSFQLVANVIIFVPLGAGLLLFWGSFAVRKRKPRSDAPNVVE